MRYLFDDCILDTEQLSLERQGQPVRLQPRVFQLLAYLLEDRQRVVPRQELFDQVWQGQYVSKSALDGCIKQARQAIGDSGRRQRLLKTQHGVGYRFVAAVTVEDTAAPQADGTALSATDHGADHTPPPVSVPERRQLTVLSCSVADALCLVRQLDPDDRHTVLRAFHTLCADTTAPYGGRVAQRLDGHCLIYFGYPQAHDDAARRAVLAGLKLLEAVRHGLPECGAQMAETGGVKIGIHTGEVVVDGDTSPDTLVVGAAPMQASALRDQATPQTLLISAQTARLVEGYVTWQALPPILLPGQRDAVPVYRVTGGSGARIRLDRVPAQRLTPFVGRAAELALLGARWVAARGGRGQAVIVRGEAGIGKSRLVRMLAEQRAPAGRTAVEGRGSPYYQQSAFYPLGDILHHVLHLDDRAGDDAVRRCEAMLQQYGMDVERHLPFVASLLNLSLPPQRYETSQLTPQQRRQRTFESLTALVLARTQQQPLLFILEDLHWVDPSTLEWLGMLLDQTPTVPLLLLLTCRSEFEVAWHSRAYLTQVTLDRLEAQHSRRMVQSLIRNRDLPVPVMQQIVEHSDGVPLFVEELTRAVLDTGLESQIPVTLQDTLTARLDQVGEARRTAQLGAVIGRQFEGTLIRAVSPLDGSALQQDLHRLVECELLYQQGVGTDVIYRFKHALIQEAAYQSLLKRSRQQYHERIARILEEGFQATAKTQPELLAHHYTEAGHDESAILYWQQAGDRAIGRSAYSESITYLTKALGLLKTLPDAVSHRHTELDLQLMLANAYNITKGRGSAEVWRAATQALELSQHIGDTSQHLQALKRLRRFYLYGGELRKALEFAEEISRLAQQTQDPFDQFESDFSNGTVLMFMGALKDAQAYLEHGAAIGDSLSLMTSNTSHQSGIRGGGGWSYWLYCYGQVSVVQWLLGYADQARGWAHETLRLATERKSRPFPLAEILRSIARTYLWCREVPTVQKLTARQIELCREHGFALEHDGMILNGWALVFQGQGARGLMQMHQVLDGDGLTWYMRPWYLALFAEALGATGKIEEGIRSLAQARELVEQTEARWCEAELSRLQGELLLAQSSDNYTEAEICFHQALDIACHQHAKAWELRAATSLACLWQSQGKDQDAYDMLAPVYEWFTEGFDTADLRQARALLNKLSEG